MRASNLFTQHSSAGKHVTFATPVQQPRVVVTPSAPRKYLPNRRHIGVPKDDYGQRGAIKEMNTNAFMKNVHSTNFDAFAEKAYSTATGINIRRNPVTGEMEMFVSGSRNGVDWLNNFAQSDLVSDYLQPKGNAPAGAVPQFDFPSLRDRVIPRSKQAQQHIGDEKYVAYLDAMAKKYHIDVVYGHSRGYMYIERMRAPVAKVGLDGAVFLSPRLSPSLVFAEVSIVCFQKQRVSIYLFIVDAHPDYLSGV